MGLFAWKSGADAVLSPCMLGGAISKPARVRSLGICLPSLSPCCVWYEAQKVFRCGRTRERPHAHLSSNHPGEKRMSAEDAIRRSHLSARRGEGVGSRRWRKGKRDFTKNAVIQQ